MLGFPVSGVVAGSGTLVHGDQDVTASVII